MPTNIFVNIGKNALKFIMKSRGIRIAKTISEKKDKVLVIRNNRLCGLEPQMTKSIK